MTLRWSRAPAHVRSHGFPASVANQCESSASCVSVTNPGKGDNGDRLQGAHAGQTVSWDVPGVWAAQALPAAHPPPCVRLHPHPSPGCPPHSQGSAPTARGHVEPQAPAALLPQSWEGDKPVLPSADGGLKPPCLAHRPLKRQDLPIRDPPPDKMIPSLVSCVAWVHHERDPV